MGPHRRVLSGKHKYFPPLTSMQLRLALAWIPKLCDDCRVERARGIAVPPGTLNERAAERAFHQNSQTLAILFPLVRVLQASGKTAH